MKKVFICSPYRGDIKTNTRRAKWVARIVVECGYLPIVPHLYFPTFLDEFDEHERIEGIKLGIELMKGVDEIWVVGTIITEGMAFELNVAKKYCIPVRLYDEDLQEIDPETISLDKCIAADYRKVVYGLKFA